MPGFDYLSLLVNITRSVPVVVMGIEQIYKDSAGASKKQLAMESLGLATYTTSQVASDNTPEINAIAQLASGFIDSIVATYNALGKFTHSSSSPTSPVPTK